MRTSRLEESQAMKRGSADCRKCQSCRECRFFDSVMKKCGIGMPDFWRMELLRRKESLKAKRRIEK